MWFSCDPSNQGLYCVTCLEQVWSCCLQKYEQRHRGGKGKKKKRLDWLSRIGLTKLHALQNYLWGELAIHGCMLCPWKTSIWRQGREACAGSASWGVKSEAQRLIWGQLEDNWKFIDKPSELPLNPTYWIYFEQFYSVLLLKSSCSVHVLSLLQTKTVCN